MVLYSRLASTWSGIQIKVQNKMLAAKNAARCAACSSIIRNICVLGLNGNNLFFGFVSGISVFWSNFLLFFGLKIPLLIVQIKSCFSSLFFLSLSSWIAFRVRNGIFARRRQILGLHTDANQQFERVNVVEMELNRCKDIDTRINECVCVCNKLR